MEDWIVIPGQYSGDMWHAAAAALLNPKLGIYLAVGNDTKDIKGADDILQFFNDIGLGNRIEVIDIKPAKTAFVDGEEREAKDIPGKALAWQYLGAVQQKKVGSRDRLHVIYRSTSFVMRAIVEFGKEPVLQALGAGLTAGLGRTMRKFVANYAATVLKPFKNGRVLFVLGRIAKYNTQHDLNPERLNAIAAIAEQEGYSLVIIGWPIEIARVAKEAGVDKSQYTCVDLRDWQTLTGAERLEERARAYFWRCVVRLAQHKDFNTEVKLVGGRSGSTDIAAFMGVEVLSWDIFDVFNPEYLRLLITAPCLLQVTHIDQELGYGAVFLQPQPGPQFDTDLCDFLQGKFKPAQIVFGLSVNARKKGVQNQEAKEIEILKSFMEVFALVWVVRTDGPWFVVDTRPKALIALHVELTGQWSKPLELVDLFAYIAYVSEARRKGLSSRLEVTDVDPLWVYFDLDLL